MHSSSVKIAIIAGEVSGDLLATDLVISLKKKIADTSGAKLELKGVGGDGLAGEGLKSLFDYSELSIIGFSAVLRQLPKLLLRIQQTARAIIDAKPDVLIIVDSPDFTHRVAKKVHHANPDIPIINYVCPTVWAWKPQRAKLMAEYVSHVLSVLPFEPKEVAKLGGPPLTYVGHRLVENEGLLAARQAQLKHQLSKKKNFLLLPGSRSSEIKNHLDIMRKTAVHLSELYPEAHFIMPTTERLYSHLNEETKGWQVPVRICSGEDEKWRAFASADAALAASGTILLELAMARVPCISIYKTDFILGLLSRRITAWSAALPNLIVGYPAVTEIYNESIRTLALAKRLGRLSSETLERAALIESFDDVYEKMAVDTAPSEAAADIVVDFIKPKKTP